ncbi:hypothetical protein [Ehrlichia canis]|uniref:hypothetical protein n=1 Tax=Ehrlichia canis TaxID=944 RepID=UPI000C83C848|nr:hypothetical protein [Ehrlichia canis]AUO54497.1 hypothetical protein C1I72_01080 [Ehrlichia canis]UKC53662.1 hypothetical protein s20019040002_000705 [Ehrlichia canis]UKC54600.1 hypothetical protein s20026770001_000706 [Ehrlichia canis]UKC55536.1 hypothetical protein s21009500007_000706 [Ehrlichia canis]
MEIDIVNLVMLVLFALMVLAMLVQLCLSLKQEYDRKKEKLVDKEKLFSEYLSSIGTIVCAETQASLALNSAKRIAVNANRAKEDLENTVNLQCRGYVSSAVDKIDSILDKPNIERQDILWLRNSLLAMQNRMADAVSRSKEQSFKGALNSLLSLHEMPIVGGKQKEGTKES